MKSGVLTRLFLQMFKNDIKVEKTKDLTPTEVRDIITKKFDGRVGVNFNDRAYVVSDEGFLTKLKDNCWWSNTSIRYKNDVSDCEDYAEFTNSMVGLLWGINTLGVAYGYLNGSPHAFQLPIAINKEGGLDVWLYDPMINSLFKIDDIDEIINKNGMKFTITLVEYY